MRRRASPSEAGDVAARASYPHEEGIARLPAHLLYDERAGGTSQTAADDVRALRDAIAALGDGSDASKQLFAVARRAVVMKDAAGPVSSAEWANDLVRVVEPGHDLAWRQQLAGRASKVDYDEIRRVIAGELGADSAAWLVAGPEESVRAVFGALGLTPTPLPAH